MRAAYDIAARSLDQEKAQIILMAEHNFTRHRGWIIQKPTPSTATEQSRRKWKMKYRDAANGGKNKTYTSSVWVKNEGKASRDQAVEECKAHIDRLLDSESVKPITFAGLYAVLLKGKIRKGVRTSTLSGYRDNERFYNKFFGKKLVHEITVEDIERFVDYCRKPMDFPATVERLTKLWQAKHPKRKVPAVHFKPRSPGAINKHLDRLTEFFRFAIKKKHAAENPVEHIERLSTNGTRTKKTGCLLVEEARALVEECRSEYRTQSESSHGRQLKKPPEWLFRFCLIGLHTGLRRSNITGSKRHDIPPLRWGDVDLESGVIVVKEDHSKNARRIMVPLHPELWVKMAEWKASDEAQDDDLVIGVEIEDVRTALKNAFKRAGIENEEGLVKDRPHAMRHTVGTHLRLTYDKDTSEQMLGHQRKSSSNDHYWHPDTIPAFQKLRKQVNELPALLNENQGKKIMTPAAILDEAKSIPGAEETLRTYYIDGKFISVFGEAVGGSA